MDGIFPYTAAARDQFYDATDVAADIVDLGHGESVLYIPSDKPFLAQADDLKIVHVVSFEVMVRPGGGAVQVPLQFRRNFYPHE